MGCAVAEFYGKTAILVMPLLLIQSPSGSGGSSVNLGYARALHRAYKDDIQNMMLCLEGEIGVLLVEFKQLTGPLAGRFVGKRVVKKAAGEILAGVASWYACRRGAFYCTEDSSFVVERGSLEQSQFWNAAQFLQLRVGAGWEERPCQKGGPFSRVVAHPRSKAYE